MHNKWSSVEDLSPSGSLVDFTVQAVQIHCAVQTHTFYAHYHAHKTLRWERLRGVQSCVPGPVGVASLPAPQPWHISWRFTLILFHSSSFSRFKFPCLLSQLSLVVQGSHRNHSLVWLWDEHSSHHCWSHGDTADPIPLGQGTRQGPGPLPSWGITPTTTEQTQTPPTSKPGSAEELWQGFAPAQQCKMKISSFTALPPARHPWAHNGKTLYKFLDHIFSYFITKSSYRNYIDMSTLPSKLILHHTLESLLLSQAFCRWATAKGDEPYLHLDTTEQSAMYIKDLKSPMENQALCWSEREYS